MSLDLPRSSKRLKQTLDIRNIFLVFRAIGKGELELGSRELELESLSVTLAILLKILLLCKG